MIQQIHQHALIVVNMSEGSAKRRLTKAAEALVEAATLDAGTVTNKEVVVALESLKTSFDNKFNTVVQKIDSSNENFDAKINSLNQHLESVKTDIRLMKEMMEEENKQTRLHRAREYVELSSFTYYVGSYGKESKDLAKRALMWFSIDNGINLPNGAMRQNVDYYGANKDEVAKSKQAFRDNFSKQMKELINRDPRLVKGENGVWTMYYS